MLYKSAWVALSLSLKIALCTTIINLILGIGLGWILARCRFIGREWLDSLLTLPIVMPPTVLGYYLLVLLGKKGVIGQWLHGMGIQLIFTWQGAVIASVVMTFPLIFKSARTAFEGIPLQLEHAGRTLGLSEMALFWRISLPLAWRGILVGVLLVFARALGEFGATLMVAGSIPGQTETLSIAIYEAVQNGQDNLANQLVILIIIICIIVLLLVGYFTKTQDTY